MGSQRGVMRPMHKESQYLVNKLRVIKLPDGNANANRDSLPLLFTEIRRHVTGNLRKFVLSKR